MLCFALSSFSLFGSGDAGNKILYGKIQNTKTAFLKSGKSCEQIAFHSFKGGGLVKVDGKNNNLNMETFPTSLPQSKKHENYYFIHAKESPLVTRHQHTYSNLGALDQQLAFAAFDKKKPDIIRVPDGKQIPTQLITSKDNRYLIYVLTAVPASKQGFPRYDIYAADSDLVVKDLKKGIEKTVIKGKYNQRLFESFLGFSKDGDAIYTVMFDGKSFKLVKIVLETGEILDFQKVFPSFSWDQLDWNTLYPRYTSEISYFVFSPDESMLMVYTNKLGKVDPKICFMTSDHKLSALDVLANTTKVYSEGLGRVSALSWKKDNSAFAYAVLNSNACYPEYVDSKIFLMNKDGQGKDLLIQEDKSKILGMGWSPDEKTIGYGVYGMDLIGKIKTINALSKEAKEIVNTKQTEGKVDPNAPMTLVFVDWVEE